MRIVNPFLRNQYQILEPLGEGLTSRVYKAIRRDKELKIEQTVALKILHSQNQVRSLKNEIKILAKMKSSHCVQLLGWERLPQGPAIVLEYLEGVSLADFYLWMNQPSCFIDEIVAQVQDGLRDLSQAGLCHGDLSAKNIFITSDGVVKLLDFGFSGETEAGYGTPQFLAPEMWLGHKGHLAGDLFSLGLLREDMISGELMRDRDRQYWKERALAKISSHPLLRGRPDERDFLPLESKKQIRADLGTAVLKVRDLKAESQQQTVKVHSYTPTPSIKRGVRIPLVFSLVFCLYCHQLQPEVMALDGKVPSPPQERFYSLDVRSRSWAQVQLFRKYKDGWIKNHKATYTPIVFKHLPPGLYRLEWTSPSQKHAQILDLRQSQKMILK